MIKKIEDFAKEFLKESKNKPVRIISHHDTDGITSAAILAKTLKRLDKKFTIRIVKNLEQEIINQETERQNTKNEVLIFSDLASNSLDYFKNLSEKIFILDHHEIDKQKLQETNNQNQNKIKIINPHLFGEETCTGAGLCYLFSKSISPKNLDLSRLAIIGMIGDRQEGNLSKINQRIINETDELTIKKGLAIYPATRSLRRALEYSTSPYIPGVTGNGAGVIELLRETGIQASKSLLELNENETSKLITAILLKKGKGEKKNSVGNLYILKFFNTKEDVREISVLINACSRLGYHDIALGYCLENEKAKSIAQDIYAKYKQELVSGLRLIETQKNIEKIEGDGFIILNAKNQIKDAIVGTICSMLSSSMDYEEGTVLIGMAYNKDKIKVSARIAGRDENGRNLKDVLQKTITSFKQSHPDTTAEVGGHHFAAGCLIERDKEKEFIDELKHNLEIEIMKV